ncbi:MAG: DUF3027 domain-containing protein [Thermoleophilaceae bacterium]
MSGRAADTVAIGSVRAAVPEFEDAFEQALEAEEGALGAFHAICVLADWVALRLRDDPADGAARRAVGAVERLLTDGAPLGEALTEEFVEAAAGTPDVLDLLGPRTRELTRPARRRDGGRALPGGTPRRDAATGARWRGRMHRDPAAAGYRREWRAQQCAGCRHWRPLRGPLGADHGACANPDSRFDQRVMLRHDGCEAFEQDGPGPAPRDDSIMLGDSGD